MLGWRKGERSAGGRGKLTSCKTYHKKMKDENLIHVKLEFEEALQSKKDILSTQKDLIELLQSIKNYSAIRKEELNLKIKIHKKIKELKSNLSKLNQTVPKIKIPEILKKDEETEEKPKLKIKTDYHDKDLESQLEEIQRRLRSLS